MPHFKLLAALVATLQTLADGIEALMRG